jgi:hypothetical protein
MHYVPPVRAIVAPEPRSLRLLAVLALLLQDRKSKSRR